MPHVLVDAEHGDALEPGRVLVEPLETGFHGAPQRVPVHAEPAGQTRDARVLTTDLLDRPPHSARGQQRPRRRHVLVLLNESPFPTGELGAYVAAFDGSSQSRV